MLRTLIIAAVVAAAPAAAFAKACPVERAGYTMVDQRGVTGQFRFDGRGMIFEVSDNGRLYGVPVTRGPRGGVFMFTQHMQALDNVYSPRDNVAPDWVFIPDISTATSGRRSQANMFRMTTCRR